MKYSLQKTRLKRSCSQNKQHYSSHELNNSSKTLLSTNNWKKVGLHLQQHVFKNRSEWIIWFRFIRISHDFLSVFDWIIKKNQFIKTSASAYKNSSQAKLVRTSQPISWENVTGGDFVWCDLYRNMGRKQIIRSRTYSTQNKLV